jgi:hypothetical protein
MRELLEVGLLKCARFSGIDIQRQRQLGKERMN